VDVSRQFAFHGVAHLWRRIARCLGQVRHVRQTRRHRGRGVQPVVQLLHQAALQQGDEQGVAAEQGHHEQQQGDDHQPTAQREPPAPAA
jgi:hypothetical protein